MVWLERDVACRVFVLRCLKVVLVHDSIVFAFNEPVSDFLCHGDVKGFVQQKPVSRFHYGILVVFQGFQDSVRAIGNLSLLAEGHVLLLFKGVSSDFHVGGLEQLQRPPALDVAFEDKWVVDGEGKKGNSAILGLHVVWQGVSKSVLCASSVLCEMESNVPFREHLKLAVRAMVGEDVETLVNCALFRQPQTKVAISL